MTASLDLRTVVLRVPGLDAALDFYVRRLGFTLVDLNGASASLATAPDAAPLLTLQADPAAKRPADDAAGLFHVALNTWGAPRRPRDPQSLGLVETAFAVAGTSTPQSIVDPDGIELRLIPAA